MTEFLIASSTVDWLDARLAGYTQHLVSVIPPGVTLSPSSKITSSQLGKVPGIKYNNGTWGGYDWRHTAPSRQAIHQWAQDGANIGLRAGSFPGLDIDSTDEAVVDVVRGVAFSQLGITGVRIGRAPKSLLVYRTDTPFTRMRIWFEKDGVSHLVEMLGDGQQYLIGGTHPATLRPYTWDEFPTADKLPIIDRAQVEHLFRLLDMRFTTLGYKVRREGDGQKIERERNADQAQLRAPDITSLRQAVSNIPNREPTREAYIKMGAAIKAAAGPDNEEEGYAVFADWADRWEHGVNAAETIFKDWDRLYPPFSVGWGFIVDRARDYNPAYAASEFTAVEAPVPVHDLPRATAPSGEDGVHDELIEWSEFWLAKRVVEIRADRIRYCPATKKWLVWDGSYWKPDAARAAQHEITEAITEVVQAHREKLSKVAARKIESAPTLNHVTHIIQGDRTIAVEVTSLDTNPWLLNTPLGTVDLRTGVMLSPDPNHLHTKITRVGPVAGAMPNWTRFLYEATQSDVGLMYYLQLLGGYCLTGDTSEQMFAFLWGEGGNGKGTFIHTIREILGGYAAVAQMETFLSSGADRHPTDLAALVGARLVVASETQEGRRWDEQKIKQLSGGDPVSARFMHQDLFTYDPQFKLVFLGNYQPAIRTVDEAMRRRVHMVGFMQAPAEKDLMLREKLREEYPAILEWLLQGCLSWQKEGLKQPPAVTATTATYFDEQDSTGHWLEECCSLDSEAITELRALFQSWSEWCREHGIKTMGDSKTISQALRAKGFEKSQHPENRRAVFKGIRVRPTDFTHMGG